MPVSPQDFALWASATGNKYPATPEEKMAAAPHAHEFVRNFAKTGSNPGVNRVGSNVIYNQPISDESSGSNKTFDAPVTPDNDIPKVRGTYDQTLTGRYYNNEQENRQEDISRQHNIIDTIGKTALAAGVTAAGIALATNPSARQAISSAGTSIKENAQNIGSRVSSFLGGLGVSNSVDPDVIRNSGDVTPPTTAQRYNQDQIATATQEVQSTKNAYTSPSTGENLTVQYQKDLETAPTTSQAITSSQTFAPGSVGGRTEEFLSNVGMSPVADPWTGERTPALTGQQRIERANAQVGGRIPGPVRMIKGNIPDPWTTRRQRPTSSVDPISAKAYDLIAAGAESGHKISMPEALEFLSGGEVSPGIQAAHQAKERIAIGSQTFSPEERQTGRMMEMKTGEVGNLESQDLLERYVRDNELGLTKRGRQSAGRENLTGEPEGMGQPQNVIATAGGRTMRNLGVLDPEALMEGRMEYQPFTSEVIEPPGSTRESSERAQQIFKSATSQRRTSSLNEVLAPGTSATNLNLKTLHHDMDPFVGSTVKRGITPISTRAMQSEEGLGGVARNIYDRASAWAAKNAGVELPEKINVETGKLNPDYLEVTNQVLYGNNETRNTNIQLLGKAFNKELKNKGIYLENSDPYAVHNLFGIARGATTPIISLQEFSRNASRSTQKGLIKSPDSPVRIVATPRSAMEASKQAIENYNKQFRKRTSSRAMEFLEQKLQKEPQTYAATPQETVDVWRSGL